MRMILRAAACVILALTGSGAFASCNVPDNANALATAIAAGVNDSRRANGVETLTYNSELGRAAMTHACDMMTNDFFAHRGTDGSNSQARVRRAGYRDCIVAENIAWGYPRPEQIISGWMSSDGHRRNMLHPRMEEFGIGVTMGPRGPYWVLVVAAEC